MFSSKKKYITIGAGLCTALMWYIQVMQEKPATWPFSLSSWATDLYGSHLYPNRIVYGTAAGAIIIFLNVAGNHFFFNAKRRKLIRSIMKQLVIERFENEISHYRLTVFRKRSGIYTFTRYTSLCFFRYFFRHVRRKNLWSHICQIPNPSRSYLNMEARSGTPNEHRSSTVFPIADREDEADGIASYVWVTQKPYYVHLEMLAKNGLPQKMPALKQKEKKSVKKSVKQYLTKTKLKSRHRLVTIHRHSPNIWANPIWGSDENLWGVLVLDCDLKGNIFHADNVIERDLLMLSRTLECVIRNAY